MIELRRVQKRYDQFQLQIERLNVRPGLTLVVGKNGAGKSTLLQLLATAVKSDFGMIAYAGKRAEDDLALIRSEIGFLPAEIDLYGEMTAKQLLHYLGELKGLGEREIRGEATHLLTQFQLNDIVDMKIERLSEGNRQRVAIAQALLGSPAFLFLDEPLNNLDIVQQKQVITSLYRYAARRTVIVSTHELNSWEGHCDDILWLHDGEVRFYGSPEEWSSQPFLRVWEGTVDNRVEQVLKNYPVTSAQQQEDGHYRLRLIAADQPDEQFVQVTARLEDGFFMRLSKMKEL